MYPLYVYTPHLFLTTIICFPVVADRPKRKYHDIIHQFRKPCRYEVRPVDPESHHGLARRWSFLEGNAPPPVPAPAFLPPPLPRFLPCLPFRLPARLSVSLVCLSLCLPAYLNTINRSFCTLYLLTNVIYVSIFSCVLFCFGYLHVYVCVCFFRFLVSFL